MNTDIVVGNKLIAEFMGILLDPLSNTKTSIHFGSKPLQYHSSWNWLMPVVEEISLIPFPKENGWKEEDYKDFSAYPYPRTFGMRNEQGKFMVRLNANQLFEADTLIEATWLAVVDFITWYNTQNKQP